MLNIMKYEESNVEVITWNGKVLFNPYQVGKCLGIVESTVRNYLSTFNNNQVVKIRKNDVRLKDNLNIPTSGRSFLTESGVYKLAFKSRKPEAEKFTDWVTDEVVPTIRKTGKYEIPKDRSEYEITNKTYKHIPVMREDFFFSFFCKKV
ncbi:MAG: BRO family protein [Peptoniphilaceae bacterium]|nr:hypothetical protein [Peptoniphilaceae bacterium]MDD7383799.1 BRO family protein [Peptoniphilaceae bacterium]MDY3737803.1 BRO family protein [Peptoniphilaceae bacterium]